MKLFEEIGTPVWRELTRAGLPATVMEHPSSLLSHHRVHAFRARCARLEKLDDPGWRIAAALPLVEVLPPIVDLVASGATLHQTLRWQSRQLLHATNFVLETLTVRGDDCIVSFNEPETFDESDDGSIQEWIRLVMVINTVRLFAGPRWQPAKLWFRSAFTPGEAALEGLSGAEILTGRSTTAVSIPADLLGRTAHAAPSSGALLRGASDDLAPTDFANALRAALAPYVREERIDIEFAAELAETSPRTLQRSLARCGWTYRGLLDQARFDVASEMLADPGRRLIDVALEAGHATPSSFSRAFRRIAGTAPAAYRKARSSAGARRTIH